MKANRAWILPVLCLGLLALPLCASAQSRVDNPHGDLAEPCATCHDAEGWTPAQIGPDYDHSRYGIELTGAHAQLACLDCHDDLAFSATSSDCVDCHLDVHRGELGVQCDRCHGDRSFIDVADQRRMERTPARIAKPVTRRSAPANCSGWARPPTVGRATDSNTKPPRIPITWPTALTSNVSSVMER